MENDLAISIKNVSKDFVLPHEKVGSVKGMFTSMFNHATSKKETQHALKNISFDIKKGEFFGIVGRNGSGKSTLLKIIASIYQPTKGSVVTRGKLVPFIELGVGFNPELTGRENIYLNGAILGMTREEIKRKFNEIVAFAEIEKFLDTPVKRYSSGMYVRLAFAVAAHLEPEILIVDEVLAVGDAQFQKKCLGKIRDVASGGRTVLFVSHNLEAVNNLCQHVILLSKGVVAGQGPSCEVLTRYANENELRASTTLRTGTGSITLSLSTDTGGAATDLHFKLICQADREVRLNEFALIIEKANGQRVGLIDLRVLQSPIQIKVGTTEYILSIENNYLVPGQYLVKAWVEGDGIAKDSYLNSFEIVGSNYKNRLSLYSGDVNGVTCFVGRVKVRGD